jgi:polyphosphate glucokinase
MSDASAPETALGVDIGGSAIESAPVDIVSGRLLRPGQHVHTPNPSTPNAVGEVVGELVRQFGLVGPSVLLAP